MTAEWIPRTEDCGTAEVSPGQKVVYRVMMAVVTERLWAGQLVTSGGHKAIVTTEVSSTVEVVTVGVEALVEPLADDGDTDG